MLYVEIPDNYISCPLNKTHSNQCRIAPIICDGELKKRPAVCPLKVKPVDHFPCSASVDLVLQAIACLKNVIERKKNEVQSSSM